jgi:hypothetical protein
MKSGISKLCERNQKVIGEIERLSTGKVTFVTGPFYGPAIVPVFPTSGTKVFRFS